MTNKERFEALVGDEVPGAKVISTVEDESGNYLRFVITVRNLYFSSSDPTHVDIERKSDEELRQIIRKICWIPEKP